MFFDKFGSDDWRIRRRIVILTLLWAAALVTYLAVFGLSDPLRETSATSLILLIGSLIGSYVFGVIWDNKTKVPSATTEIKQTIVAPTTAPVETPPAEPKPPEGFAS